MAYLIIFLFSLSAATILPLSSEATLLYYLNEGESPWVLFIVAGIGNILGSVINYFIGKKGVDYLLSHKKISEERIKKSETLFQKYGTYALLFSWVPIIGDPLTLVAGVLHFDFRKFLLIVSIAKFGRYLLLILGYQSMI
ncbi:MAG: YqaA family protein [Campylobacterota bacterium]|nr:YqaA family protein [Campylobacterota bacterium]